MKANDYHFVTRWRIEGGLREVADILSEPMALPEWWPAVYLRVRELEHGHPLTRLGRVLEVHTKGWLPYTLVWRLRVVASNHPLGWTLEASGDFTGRGIWTLSQHGPVVFADYDWTITAQKPLLRWFSAPMRWIFAANHRWAMRTGERSLQLEVLRRRARSDAERRAVPAPPQPTFAPLPGRMSRFVPR